MTDRRIITLVGCLLALVAFSGDSPAVGLGSAQQALASQGLNLPPQLVTRALPALDAAVQRRLALEDAVEHAPRELATLLDRPLAEAPAVARALDALVDEARQRRVMLVTDASWKLLVAADPPAGWERTDFDDAWWKPAVTQGGLGVAPWRMVAGFAGRTQAQWIWSYASNRAGDLATVLFRRRFVAQRAEATLFITADNVFDVFLDGRPVGHGADWTRAAAIPLRLKPGQEHLLAVRVVNQGGPGGLLVDLR